MVRLIGALWRYRNNRSEDGRMGEMDITQFCISNALETAGHIKMKFWEARSDGSYVVSEEFRMDRDIAGRGQIFYETYRRHFSGQLFGWFEMELTPGLVPFVVQKHSVLGEQRTESRETLPLQPVAESAGDILIDIGKRMMDAVFGGGRPSPFPGRGTGTGELAGLHFSRWESDDELKNTTK